MDKKSESSSESDIEKGLPYSPPYPDPFLLRNGFLPESQLTLVRETRGKKAEKYQREQNQLIDNLLKPIEDHTSEAEEAERASRTPVKIAVWASLIANFSLCVLQLYAAISSKSLSILSTGVDSIFDLGSNLLLFYMHRKSELLDVNKWPIGGARLEPIANIVYGSLMSAVNLIVVVEGIQTLITHISGGLNRFNLPSLIAVGAALGVKLLLFLYCFSLRNKSSQVRVLWEDHRNDLFINSFAILMSAGGSRLRWWLDPVGGVVIASGVILAWSRTIGGEFALLAGKVAENDFLRLIIYKVITFHDAIESVDTVRAYHSGPEYFVEVDIVMPASTLLRTAHDIAERLQDKIESLPGVDRAFVHVDYEATHYPEHRKQPSTLSR